MSRIVNKLWKSIGKTSSSDVVDHSDGVLLSSSIGGTGIDDHLTPPLHLRVLPLNTREVKLGGRGTRRHRRGCSSSETDEHTRPPENDDVRVGGDGGLEGVGWSNISKTSSKHDGFVVASNFESCRGVERGLGRDGEGESSPESVTSTPVVKRSGILE